MDRFDKMLYDAIDISRNIQFDWKMYDYSGAGKVLNNMVPHVRFCANDVALISERVQKYAGISGYGYMRECNVIYNQKMFIVEVISIPHKLSFGTECKISVDCEHGVGRTCLYYTKF